MTILSPGGTATAVAIANPNIAFIKYSEGKLGRTNRKGGFEGKIILS